MPIWLRIQRLKSTAFYAALMPFAGLEGAMPRITYCWTSFFFLEVSNAASLCGAGINSSFREYRTLNAFQRTEQVLPEFRGQLA